MDGAATCGHRWCQGLWHNSDKLQSINWKELEAYRLALHHFASEVRNRVVLIRSDNTATVHYINAGSGRIPVLADLARSSECKVEIVQACGVEPLVRMLGSASNKAQMAASIAVAHLACTGENKLQIASAGGIVRLVTVLGDDNKEAKRHATAALCSTAHST